MANTKRNAAKVNASAKAAANGRKGNAMKNTNNAKETKKAIAPAKIDEISSKIVAEIFKGIDLEALVKEALENSKTPDEKETEPSEAQLKARKEWGERKKAAAERRNLFKSPEYTELWERWKKRKAKAYDAAKTRADKKELNHEGHVWVMEQLEKAAKKSAAPTKKATKKVAAK